VLQNFITLGKQNRLKIYGKRGEEEKCFLKKSVGWVIDLIIQLKSNSKSEQFIWLSKKIETN
jgi:hypothetical protein